MLAGGADSQTVRTVDLGELMWFKNQGGWALSERRILAADVVDAALIRPADIDGDGAVDLVPG